MIPTNREDKVQWIQQNLIPLLDSQIQEYNDEDPDEEQIQRSREILAEEYLDQGRGVLKTMAKLGLGIAVIDLFTFMPPQVYGLVFSITGTLLMLVEGNILGSKSITVRSKDSVREWGGREFLDEKKARRLAHNTVITNIGLIWLVTGFVMQIVAVWFVTSRTLISPIIYLI